MTAYGGDVAFDVTAETDAPWARSAKVETRVNDIRGANAEVDIKIMDNAAEVKIAELAKAQK